MAMALDEAKLYAWSQRRGRLGFTPNSLIVEARIAPTTNAFNLRTYQSR